MGNEQGREAESEVIPEEKEIRKCIQDFQSHFAKLSLKDMINVSVPNEFVFNLDYVISHAKFALESDESLSAMRNKLVPASVKEDDFWKRYFYLLRQFSNAQRQPSNDDSSPIVTGAVAVTPSHVDNTGADIVESKTNDNSASSPPSSSSSSASPPSKKERKKKKKIVSAVGRQMQMGGDEKKSNTDSDSDTEAYQLLLIKPCVWLYRIPAQLWRGRSNKATDWDLNNPLWTGRLRIIAYNHGQQIVFQFLQTDGQIFLQSLRIPLHKITDDNPIHQYFDAYGCTDSSRYFIIWVETPTKVKRRIPFGFGMRERQDAFDIRACVADQMKIVQRSTDDIDQHSSDESQSDNSDDNHSSDTGAFTLAEDELISIANANANANSNADGDVNSIVDPMMLLLPPPPDSPLPKDKQSNATADVDNDFSDDWTDFQSA